MNMLPIIAVLTTSILSLILAIAWYSEYLFGKIWRAASGTDEEEFSKHMAYGGVKIYVMSLFSTLITSVGIAILLIYTNTQTAEGAALLGGLLWVGFTTTQMITSMLRENKPVQLFLVDTSYQFISIVGSSLILYSWIVA